MSHEGIGESADTFVEPGAISRISIKPVLRWASKSACTRSFCCCRCRLCGRPNRRVGRCYDVIENKYKHLVGYFKSNSCHTCIAVLAR